MLIIEHIESPEKLKKESKYTAPYKERNLIQRQAESDQKPFPVMLDTMKRSLQQRATQKEEYLHNIIRIILLIDEERTKILRANPGIGIDLVISIYEITAEDVCDFINEYKKTHNTLKRNNVQMMTYAFRELVKKKATM